MKIGVKIHNAKASLDAHVVLKLMGIWEPESIS